MKTFFAKTTILLLFLALGTTLSAQKYFTKAGEIVFHSDAPLEKIEATNGTVTAVLDAETGRLQFAALIKAFRFEKALMQEHFNENYMESSKFPKATFSGEITDGKVDWTTPGSYDVTVAGELTIHGETKTVSAPATIVVREGGMDAISTFTVAVADYGIEIPKVVAENIAKNVEIRVKVALEPLAGR